MFTFLTYRHGDFGPAFFGPLRRLCGSPVQSNWRIYVRDDRTGKEGVYFVTSAVTTARHALGARLMAEKFYLTTAIAYPNGKPHIGHAYEAIAADAIARFQRMQGRDVRLVTGTDEHGLKMYQTARDQGRRPCRYTVRRRK